MDKSAILRSALNESSAAGVVDIFFESEFKKMSNICKDDWVCDCDSDPSKKTPTGEGAEEKRQFVLIQNPFYLMRFLILPQSLFSQT